MSKKIKVKPEGRQGVWLVSKKEISSFVKKLPFDKIHNYPGNNSHLLIGADHLKEFVLKDIKNADRIAILTGKAKSQNVGHSLAVIINERLEMFDIGEITEKDLHIEI